MRAIVIAVGLLLGGASGAGAQGLGGYLTGGTGSIDYIVHRETIAQAAGGVFWSLPGDRVRVGAEVNALTSNGYVTGRGGPVAELTLIPRSRFRPFVRGGALFGEDSSGIAGAGVDLMLTETSGLRVFVQDAFRPSRFSGPGEARYTFHEPSFQVGWVWR